MAQTATPSSLPATPSPTPSLLVNPSTGLVISEISPTSETEWIELFNQNDCPVQLNKWKLQTETATRNLPDNLVIDSNSFFIFNSTNFLSDSTPKTVKLVDQAGAQIFISSAYPANLDNGLSWSKQSDNSWCSANPSPQQPNSGCYTPPTDTPKPTATSTPPPTPIPSVPPTITSTPIPTISPGPFPTSSEEDFSKTDDSDFADREQSPGLVLSAEDSFSIESSSSALKFPAAALSIVFIVLGGILLLIPLVISEIKKKQFG